MALNKTENNKTLEIKIKKLRDDAKIPTMSTEHCAGFDIYSVEDYEFSPGETHTISTGISLEIPTGKVLLIWDRSGLGSKGIHRFAGVIDSDYRGEIKIVLHNSNSYCFRISKGDRICQGIIQDYYIPIFKEVYSLSETERGEKGFGSSGL